MALAQRHKNTRGGFFFAVMALAILSLVLLTVQLWVKTFEQSDYRASQRFKAEAMRSILSTVSDESLSQFANASAFYATYRLANYTSDQNNGLAGTASAMHNANNPNTGMVEKTVFELMQNGISRPDANSEIIYTPDENASYTIGAWQGKIDAAANAMGFDLQFSDVKNFDYWQIDPWTVGVKFEFGMNITDREGTMRQNRTMRAESNFSISGFLDPSITRNDMAHRTVARDVATEKQVFKFEKYSTPSDVAPWMVDSTESLGNGRGPEGYGWFFGPVIEKYPEVTAADVNLKQYVLVHSWDANLSSYADNYGAVVVTTQPVVVTQGCQEIQTQCLNCMKRDISGPGCPPSGDPDWYLFPPNNNPVSVPVIVAGGDFSANYKKVMDVTRKQDGVDVTEKYLLIDNRRDTPSEKMADGYHRIWDITKLRDMAICGFYVQGKGPSFFQRMLANSQTMPNPVLGIESFVVGKWAGGAEDTFGNYAADLYSRLDWEFYTKKAGNDVSRVKGMMGCKGKDMCTIGNRDAIKFGVGKFRLSDDAAQRYGVAAIGCKTSGQAASCD